MRIGQKAAGFFFGTRTSGTAPRRSTGQAGRAGTSLFSVLVLVAATLTFMTATAVVAPTPANAAIPGQGTPFDCYGGIIYNTQQGNPANNTTTGTINAITTSTLTGATPVTVTTTAVTTIPQGGRTNSFGITRGGSYGYVIDQVTAVGSATTTVHRYDTTSQSWSVYTGTATAGTAAQSFVAGAVDPFSGIYYYAQYLNGVATVYGFNTNTNTAIPGIIATITLPIAGTGNGDMAFDQAGNLYLVESIAPSAAVAVVKGPLPSTGSSTGTALTSTTLQTYTVATGVNYNGIAFDNVGNLYAQYADTTAITTSLVSLNPNTGAITGGPKLESITGTLGTDIAACSLNPTLSVAENVVARANTGDQFSTSITGGSITANNTATTTGTATGLQNEIAGPVIGYSGTSYTVAQTASGGGNLADYITTYSCTDAAASNRVVASGTGSSFTLNFPTPATNATGPFVTCTFTNTPRPTITVTAALGGTRANTGDQFTTAIRTGGVSGTVVNTTTNSTSTGTGSTITAGTGTTGEYTAAVGTTYTITEGASGGTNFAQYTRLITCVDANGFQTGLPTNQAYSAANGLNITPVAGAAISCVITNTPISPTIVLSKVLGGPRAVAGDQFTVAIRTGSVTGTVVNSTANSTTTGTGSTVTAGTGTTGTYTATAGTTYYLTETSPANYNSLVTCTDTNGVQTSGLPTAAALGTGIAVTPVAGAALSCTLTNTGTAVNLSLAKTNPTQLVVGTAANYTLAVTNNGGTTATTARVVDVLPAGLQYNSVAGTGWTCSAAGTVAAGQTVTCNFTGSIASTATSTFTINVTPQAAAAGTTLQNRAAVDPTGGTSPVAPGTCTATGTPAGCAVAAAQTIDLITATNDTAITAPATAVVIAVLSNDTTSSGYALVPSTVTVTTAPGNGTTSVNATTGAITYTPNTNFSGVDTFVYRVCDNSTPTAVCATATVTVNVPSTVTAVNDTATTPQNTAVTTAVLANDTRTANGAPLNPASVTVTSAPANGTTSVNTGTGAITYTPNNGFTGTNTYTYRVCDSSSPTPVCATATVTVTVGANTVTAVNDSATTAPGTAVSINVRANDSTSTGQPLANPTITVAPTNGTAVVNAGTGAVTYTPNNGFSGTDTFRYQVCDTSNPTPVCSTALVTVSVPNTVTAVNDTVTTPQNTAAVTNVLANDTVSPNGAALNPASVTVQTGPSRGTTSVNTTTGAITYTPNNGYTGTDTYTYRVCDSSSPTPVCSTATVNITVGANTVTASNDTDTTAPVTPVTTNVRANDSSSTGQPLANPTVTVAPARGSTSVNATTGNITYTPASGFSGTDVYTYRVCDTSNPTPVCATATVTITVPNTVTAVNDTSTTPQNTAVTTPVLANDTITAGAAPLNPSSVTVTAAPTRGNTAVNTSTGAITYTPNNGFTGTDVYTYRACDTSTPTPLCANATVTVTVGANTVVANPDSGTTTPVTAITTNVRANDTTSTGQPLGLPTVTTSAGNGTTAVNGTTGAITYTPNSGFSGVDTYGYTVCDTSNPTPVCSSTTVTITVRNTVTVNDDIVATPQNTATTTNVLANDTVTTGGASLNPGSVVVATAAAHGTTTVNATTGAITYTPANGYTGPDSYTYTVCDRSTPTPVCGTATVNITVGGNVVTATPDTGTTPPVTPITTNVRANDTSSTGQPLANPTVTAQPAHGTASVNAGTGTITYTPAAGFSGTDVYTYQVCDTSNPTPVCASTTVTITVPNTVTAVNDSSTTPQNTAVSTNVLANDTITTGGAPLNPASVTVTSAPASGTTSVNTTTGAITYTPAAGFTGTVTYNYRVCDTSDPTPVCATATVTVTVGGNTVVANPDNASTAPGVATTVNVLANDTRSANGAPLNPASITVTTAAGHGTTTVNTTTGAITYTPANGFSGTDTFVYRVCDSSTPTPVCASATVTVQVPNTVTAVADSATTTQNTPVTLNAPANDTVSTNGAPLNLASVTVTVPALHGTTAVNATTGAITYTPANGYAGTDTYTYRICDTSTPTPVCATAVDTITIPANVVTAVNDSYTTPPVTAVANDVRANDSSATGQPLANPTVITAPGHGSTSVNAGTGVITYTPASGFSGVDTYQYRVCDTSATPVCANATVTITVPNTVTANDDVRTTPQNTAISVPVLGNDTITTGGAPLNPASVAVTTAATNGTTTVNTTTGAITYTPNTNFSGTDTFRYQVCDTSTPTPRCATALVTITVPANTITANPDSGTTPPVTPITTNVLANDTVSGAALNPASVAVTTAPGRGTTAVNTTTGAITYTPANGFSGVDTYRYQVCDTSTPTPLCASALVTITVPNTVTAVNDTSTTAQNSPVSIPVLTNDTITTGGSPLNPASVTVTAAPAHGTTAVNTTTGAITFTPTTGYSGTDTFTYRVCDSSSPTPVCATATVTVTIGNNTVTANPDARTTQPITATTTNVLSNDTVAAGGAPLNPASVTVITAPGHGTTSVNTTTGSVTYTPANGFSGVDTYVYRVCDTSSPTPQCATATVTITVPNTVTAVNDTSTTAQNTPVSVPVLGNDTITNGGAPLNPASVTVTAAPANGTTAVNTTTGAITYTPNAGFSGNDSFTYRVCDGSTPTPVCATATVNVSVGANTVTAANDTATTLPITPVTTDVRANDSSSTGQPLANPTVTTAPGHGTTSVDGATGNITYTPASGFSGVDTYGYTVCDTSAPTPVCATATVTVTVPNTVRANDDAATTAQNTAVPVNILANDTVSAGGAPLNPGTVTILTAALHGGLSVNTTTGVTTYTPAGGYTGADSFRYRVCDTSTPTPTCANATVRITVGANTVVANPDSSTTQPITPVSITVKANDTTSTGQPLGNPTVTTTAPNGSTSVNGTTGAITYTPNSGFSGVDTFGYTICDTSNPTPVCSSTTVTVTVPNVVTVNDDIVATAQNVATTTNVLANDTITTGGAPLNPASVVVATAAAHGTTSVNTTTGAITYTPAAGYTGPDSYTYTVCDRSTPTPVCGTATVNITVGANTVTATPDTGTTQPATPITVNVRANDTTSTGQPLANPTVTTPPAHGTATVNAGTGTITYTPASGFSGTDVFNYQVCDTSNPTPVCASTTVTVTVPNTVTAVNDTSTTPQNSAVSTNVLGNDTITAGGAPLNPASVTVTVPPASGTTSVNTTTGAITFTPATGFSGTVNYTYRVCDTSDPTPVCATATVTVTVGSNTVVANPDNSTTEPGVAVTTNVLANDTRSANGSPLNPASVTVTAAPAHGTTSVNTTTGAITYTPANQFSGTDTYTYRVCDSSTPTPVCATATVTVQVPNDVEAANDAATTAQNTSVVIPVLANDTVSPNGSPLNPGSVTATTPLHGTVTVNPTTGAITYSPTTGYSGPDSFSYTVCDSSTPTPVCSTAPVSVSVGTNSVVAVDDTNTTAPITAITTNVLANDTISAGGSALNPASVTVTTAPGHGTTSVNPANGAITYTPAANFSGVDTFQYQVCDSSATPVCDIALVTITVPSTVTGVDDTDTTPQNTDVTTPVLDNDTVTTGGAPLDPGSVTVVTAPAHGTTAVNPNGSITYTPDANYSGTDTYVYRVCDGSTPTPNCDPSTTVTITIGANTVTAVNDARTTQPVTPVTVDVLTNDTVAGGGASLNPGSVAVTRAAGHGTTTVNATNGDITYTPANNFSGVDTFDYRVCDRTTPTPLCATATVTITVPNTVTARADTATIRQNTPTPIPVLDNDSVTPGGAPLNPASISIPTPPAHGTVSANTTTGVITYTPDPGYSGPDSFSYTVCDSSTPTPTCSTAAIVTATVADNVVTATDDTADASPITAVVVPVLGNDTVSTDGAPLNPASVTVTTAAGHGTTTVNLTNGAITYTPASGFSGVDTFVYQVCDTSTTPICDTATVTVTVPTTVNAVDDSATTAQNTAVSTPVLGNDTVTTGAAPLAPASVTVTNPPANGTTAVNTTTGAITYTPTTGFSGTDSYTYRVCDTSTPTPVCDTAVVTVTVGSNTVTATPDNAATTPGNPVTTNVRANDSSSTGQPLANPTVSVAPGHGTTSVDPTTGSITYTPNSGFSGTDTYTYRVCDTSRPTPVCATATVTVQVPNTVTAVDDEVATPQNVAVITPVLGNDTIAANGAPLNPASVTVTVAPANGTTTVDTSTGNVRYVPATGFSGTDTFTYRVCDTSTPTPVCDTAVVTVQVGGNVVVANPDTNTTAPITSISTEGRANDTSSTGQPFAFPTITYQPAHGTASIGAATGVLVYVPENGFSGVDTFGYQVCDTSTPVPYCDTSTVTITVVDVVTANPDVVSTPQNTAVTTPVIGNDTVSTGASPVNPASVTVTVPAAHGTTSVNTTTGAITYTPEAGYSGPDSYGYRVCDRSIPTPVCDTTTVSITVGGNVVTATDDTEITQPITSVTTNVRLNDTSSTGQPLANPTVTVQPGHGTAALNAAGNIVYTPANGFSGTDSYTYQVCDTSEPTPVCDTAVVTISVPTTVTAINDAGTTAQNTPITLTVLSNDEHQTGGAALDPASVVITRQAEHGTLVVNTNGTITYTPDRGYSGTDNYIYRVCDLSTPTPVCDTAGVVITISGNTVTANPDNANTPPGEAVTTPVLANDSAATGGQPLNPASVTVTAAPGHGTTSVNTTTGAITYTPAAGFSGTDSYTYRVCDTSTPTPACATATVTVQVPNVLDIENDNASPRQNTPVQIFVLGNDSVSPNGAPLNPASVTFTPPSHGAATVDPTTGIITYTPATGYTGPDSFTYTVCDTSTPTPVCGTATISVLVIGNAVTARPDTASTAQNTPVTTTVLSNDTVSAGGQPLDPASVTVTTAPLHGTTTVNPTGTITYTPAAGFSGTDTYTYRVCDTSTPTPVCGSAAVTVSVGTNTVNAVSDTASTTPTTPVTTPVLANDTTPPGGAPLDPASVTVTSAPAHGTTTVNTTTGAVTYTPATGFSGTDSYTYRVCDTSNPTPVCDTAIVTITVTNTVTAAPDNGGSTPQNTPKTIDVLANDTVAPGGAPLNPASVTVPTPPAHGTVTVDPTTGAITYTPAAGYSGTDTFTYRVCDTTTPTPVCSTAAVTITVGANTVTATDDSATTTPVTPVTVQVLTNDTITPNGAPLDPSSVTITSTPTHGTVAVNTTTGAVTYTPANGFSGSDTFTYRVCDTSNPTPVCDTAVVTVTVVNTVDAVADEVAVAQNGTVTSPVLGNDRVSAGGAPLDPTSVTITVPPTHGTATVNPTTGAVTYTPTAGYTGADSYTYRVCDTSDPTPVCDTATVTIQVGTDVVVANPDTATVTPGNPVTIDVRANDSTSTGQPLQVPTVTVAPAHGTATVDPTTGVVTYTPAAGFSGTDTFTYQVCDTSTPTPVCDTGTVTVSVPNVVAAGGDSATTLQNAPVTVDVLANDTVSPSGAPLNPASVTVTVAPAHGTVSVNPTTGAITYTPASNYSGPDSFTYRVCDTSTPTPVCSTATVSVTVSGNGIVAQDDASTTMPMTAVAIDVLANDTVSGSVPLNPGSVTVTVPPGHGSTSVNTTTGVITYTPEANFSGTDTFTYRVCDSSTPTPVCDTAVVTVTVPNQVVANDDTVATGENDAVVIDVLADDTHMTGGAPLDPSSVRVTRAPAHGSIEVEAATGRITYTPTAGYSGPDSFDYEVCDTSEPTPVCSTATVNITVGPNTVTANDDSGTTPPVTPIVTDVLANDTVTIVGTPLNPASVTVVVAPQHGTTSVDPATGAITYTPESGFSGVDTYTYQVCDTTTPTPICATAVVTITVPNTLRAIDDTIATPQNTAIRTNVLVNDTVSTGGAPLDPGSVTITVRPAHGTVAVNPTTGVVTYTPTRGYTGPDSYTYRVCDTSTPTPVCDTAVVSITVGPDVVAASPDAATTLPGTAVVIPVLGNDTTTTGLPLDPASVTVTGDPEHGTVTVDPDTGAITYTPDAGFTGEDTFTYEVCDTSTPTPVCDETTVTVTVAESMLSLVKTASVSDTNADGVVSVGDTIDYTFAVTNTGQVGVTGVTVVDEMIGTVSCPSGALAAGATMECTADNGHVITAADAEAGGVTNSALVQAQPVCPPGAQDCTGVQSGTVTIITPVNTQDRLSIAKSGGWTDVDGDGGASPGDLVSWSIVVTNAGDTTISDIDVDDPTAGTVSCPATELAAGEQMTCTVADHVVTAVDVAAGEVGNTALASGTGPSGDVVSPTVTAVVDLTAPPAPPGPTPPAPNPPVGPQPPLSYTGLPGQELLWVGLLLLLAGLPLLVIGRRRRNRGQAGG
ncbi:tandem-95 repeat protein [Nakamurella sp. YIM 132087]|uniref:Tandem-95 repeat protein n=1 Tax=Nakamurella alba TaxID=2665158 RepID=A0A7K1FU03_9ACTN|nr:Ig-like domain-containing protein [Nakamurella alba]MTD16653.1 tandem-95 repeat protein [Nakamurella alba]